LSEDEIEKMVRDAGEHKVEDEKRADVVNTRNSLDGLIIASEKMIKEQDGNLQPEDLTNLERGISDAKAKLSSESIDELKAAKEKLDKTVHEISQKAYQQTAQAGSGEEKSGSSSSDNKDKTVDADFKEV